MTEGQKTLNYSKKILKLIYYFYSNSVQAYVIFCVKKTKNGVLFSAFFYKRVLDFLVRNFLIFCLFFDFFGQFISLFCFFFKPKNV